MKLLGIWEQFINHEVLLLFHRSKEALWADEMKPKGENQKNDFQNIIPIPAANKNTYKANDENEKLDQCFNKIPPHFMN